MTTASVGDVLQYVRTPLALAALVFLIGAPLLREISRRKGRPNEDTKAIIRYGFVLGLTFGVMAIIAFVYTASFNREIRVSGTVRDETGAGLPFVAVRIAGRDGGVTDDGGNFAFTVPDSRAANEYVADVFRDGYILNHITFKGRYPQPVSVVLKKVPISVLKVIELPSGMTIRHNLGVPQVEIAITFSNPFPKDVTLKDIGVTLVNPAGSPVPMFMEGVSVAPGQYGPALPIWKLDKGGSTTITYSFFNANPRFLELQQRVYLELAPKQFTITGPDQTARLLSNGLVKELREYMQSQFIWVAGRWQIRAACTVEGERPESDATFRLTEPDVKRMKAIADFYPAALGVAPAWRFWQSANVNPAASVLLERKLE